MIDDVKIFWPGKVSYDLLILFPVSEWKNTGAYFWDKNFVNNGLWPGFTYTWIGSSVYGDQIIIAPRTPMHDSGGIYVCGPDISGPVGVDNWPCTILYYGSSLSEWIERVKEFGDEWSLGPGGIDSEVRNHKKYKEIYRKLNPGISW